MVSAEARPDEGKSTLSERCEPASALIKSRRKIYLIWICSHMLAFIALSDLVPSMCLWHLVKHCRAQTDVL